jgi:protein SCO1
VRLAAAAALAALLASTASAGVGFEQRVGARLPLDAPLTGDDGRPATLRSLLAGRPAVLVPVFLRCPSLCPTALDGLLKALRVLSLEPGRDFALIVLSFDPADGPAAGERRRRELEAAWRGARPLGVRVVTGGRASLASICAALGLSVERQGRSGQFAHAPGLAVVTAEGVAARYLLGVEFSARELRLALVGASQGRLGRWTDQVLLLCQRYDEAAARYTRAVLRLTRALAGLAAIGLALGLVGLARAGTAG